MACFRQRYTFSRVTVAAEGNSRIRKDMSNLAQTLTDSLIPPKIRPYWTFRNMTVVVLLAIVANALVRAFVRFSPEQVARLEGSNPFHSAPFLMLYYVFVAIVFYVVYSTRNRTSWYVWRVAAFGMVLAGALVIPLDIVLPLRAF
jgi:hypothetical protein